MAQEMINSTGRRKTSVARVSLRTGKGKIKVNRRDLSDYFTSDIYLTILKQPLTALGAEDRYDINIKVVGGGSKGQSEAIRLGLARALVCVDSENKATLKKEGFLTRDPRMVERKKYGRRKARKRFQFSKR